MITHYHFLPPRKLYKLLWASRSDIARVEALLHDYFGKPVVLLNAARTGAYIALSAKGFKRTAEVLVPSYPPKCMLDTISERAVPTLHMGEHTKAVLLVHQYGYPQKMDVVLPIARKKNLLVIEDSASSFGSRYKGKLVGSFGDVAIFTFPKAFQTILGGCMVTEDKEILSYAREYLKKQDTFVWRSVSTLSLFPIAIEYAQRSFGEPSLANHLLGFSYSKFIHFPNANKRVCHLFPKSREEFEGQLNSRKENLSIFREFFGDTDAYPSDVEADSVVVPFIAPYFGERSKLDRVVKKLADIDVKTGVYHFDINRNMFDSRYVPMVSVPVHQGLDVDQMRALCEAISSA